MRKPADAQHPIHPLMIERWSPRAFADKPVETEKLLSVLEAARWAASSYNEQPWRIFIARKEDGAEFEKMLHCLVEQNQGWAKAAPVLMISVAKKTFSHDGSPNACAVHDLGLADGNMMLEAVAQGLVTHGMGGIQHDKIRAEYGLSDDYVPVAGWALGYEGDPDLLHGALKERELDPRERKALSEFVFSGTFGQAAPLVK